MQQGMSEAQTQGRKAPSAGASQDAQHHRGGSDAQSRPSSVAAPYFRTSSWLVRSTDWRRGGLEGGVVRVRLQAGGGPGWWQCACRAAARAW